MWHLTLDTSHRTGDMWQMVGSDHTLKILCPLLLPFGTTPDNTWHVTNDKWHLTPDTWHPTPDIWHVTRGGRWTSSKNFSLVAFMLWEWWCFEDWEENRKHRYNGPFWHFLELFFLHLLAPFGPFWRFLHLLALFGHSLKIHDFWYFNQFIWITSWGSVPILMCYLMQAPHWSQGHSLDSQWRVCWILKFYILL